MSWAIAGIKNNSFYEAMTNVTVKLAPKDAVIAFLKKEPDVTFDLLRRIYIGMEGLWMHFESITTGNSTIKLIASLVILAKRFGKEEKGSTVIQLKMSEQDVANYAGIARETASRELQKLKRNKIVSFENGTITVHDLQELEGLLLR
jgi:CRP/FNR family transcriptional regulator